MVSIKLAKEFKRPTYSFLGYYLRKAYYEKRNKNLTGKVVDLCDMRQGHKVLELGYGYGNGLEMSLEKVAPQTHSYCRSHPLYGRIPYFTSTFDDDGMVYGIDHSLYMHNLTKKRFVRYLKSSRLDLIKSQAEHIPLLNETLDSVYHVDCFYFWLSIDKVLQLLWKKLKQNGRIVTGYDIEFVEYARQKGLFRYGNPDILGYVMALERNGFDDIQWNKKNRIQTILARKPPIKMLL